MAAKAVEVGNDILKGNKPADPNILIPVTLVIPWFLEMGNGELEILTH
jgi:hypothetical protein